MSNQKGELVWLASYPKSGNTWVRLFLHALKTGKPLEGLNEINSAEGIGSSRNKIDHYLGMDSSELPEIEVQKLRCEVYSLFLDDLNKQTIIKTHDTPYYRGIQIIPSEGNTKVILIIRNPFDVAVSYSKHMGCSISKAVTALCNENNTIGRSENRYNAQVAQELGTWSSFIDNWEKVFNNKITVIRYEDLLNDSFNTFKELIKVLGWEYSDTAIKKAIDHSSFSRLKKLEKESGFHEKSKHSKSFFRKGVVGSGINELSTYQRNKIIKNNFKNLLLFDYISNDMKYLDEN